MKIAVVTGTRAEYGLFYWLLKAIQNDSRFALCLCVTGAHLSPEFGMTYREIIEDGFEISENIEILMSSDTPVSIAKSTALAVMGFAEAFARQKPDLVMVLGDRYEALGAAQAAMFSKIPIAHLHGGETTEGALDESIRHAITKMAHLHFPATENYRKRVIQLGEDPEHVFNVGALGVESIKKTTLLSRSELQDTISVDLSHPFFLVTYHPVTLNLAEQVQGMQALLRALSEFDGHNLIITFPNADTGGRQLIEAVQAYRDGAPERVYLTESLGRLRYLSAMHHCLAVIGNSSSGIIEAASMGVPAVDIGSRQLGRDRAESVIHAAPDEESIRQAIKHAIALNESKARIDNPYDGGETSALILERLALINLSDLPNKRFFNLNFNLVY